MRNYKDQVVLDIANYKETGKLPQSWDVRESSLNYWDWVHTKNGGIEPQDKRLDEIPFEDSREIYACSAFNKKAVDLIREMFSSLFTAREQEVYTLCFLQGSTERAAAAKLGISQPRVFEIKRSIQNKISREVSPLLSK